MRLGLVQNSDLLFERAIKKTVDEERYHPLSSFLFLTT